MYAEIYIILEGTRSSDPVRWDFQENRLQLKSSVRQGGFRLFIFPAPLCFLFSFHFAPFDAIFIDMSEYHHLFVNFRCNKEASVCHRRLGCIRHYVECLPLRCILCLTLRSFHRANMCLTEGRLVRDTL